jgi:hypothetical protein
MFNLLLCLLIVLVYPRHTSAIDNSYPKAIARPNYGYFAQYMGDLINSHSTWTHVFKVPLLGKINFEDLNIQAWKCSLHRKPPPRHMRSYIDSCDLFSKAFHIISQRRRAIQAHITQHQSAIYDLLPKSNEIHYAEGTSKRALDFIGSFSKWAFGTATMQDIESINDQVRTLKAFSNHTAYAINTIHKDFLSYSKINDKRVTNAMAAIADNRRATLAMKDNFLALRKYTGTLARSLNSAIIRARYTANELGTVILTLFDYMGNSHEPLNFLENEAFRQLQAIRTLVSGYLPPALVPPSQVIRMLTILDKSIDLNTPYFSIVHLEPAFYYHTRRTSYFYEDNTLFIRVSVPLAARAANYALYQTSALPIPSPLSASTPGTEGFTQVTGLSPYLALSYDQKFYVEISKEQFTKCTKDHYYACQSFLPLTEMERDSCSMALFLDKPDLIHKLCPTILNLNGSQETFIQDMDFGFVLVSSHIKTWVEACANSPPRMITGARFAMIHLGCECALRVGRSYIPPSLTNCQNKTSTSTIFHPVNLQFLKTFYPTPTILNITGTTLYDVPPMYESLPDVSIHRANWTNTVKQEHILSTDLKKAAKLIKEKQPLYFDAADQMVFTHAEHSTMGSSNILTWGLPSINSILVLLANVLSIYACFRIHTIAAIVQSIRPVQSRQIKFLLPNTTPTATDTIFSAEFFSNHETYFITISAIMTIYLIIRVAWSISRFYLNKHTLHYPTSILAAPFSGAGRCAIIMELFSSAGHVALHMTSLHRYPSHIYLFGQPAIQAFSYHADILSGMLHITWVSPPQLILEHNVSDPISFPNTIHVPLLAKSITRKILAGQYNCALLMGTDGLFKPIPVKNTVQLPPTYQESLLSDDSLPGTMRT